MPDDIDSQPPEENVGDSADEATEASAGLPQGADAEPVAAQPSEAPADVATPDQTPETPHTAETEQTPASTDADAADDALDWAAAATADQVLADAQLVEPEESEPMAVDGEEDDLLLSQDELNNLLSQSDELVADATAPQTAPPQSEAPAEPVSAPVVEPVMADVEPSTTESIAAEPVQLPELPSSSPAESVQNSIDLLHDVELSVKIELGRTELYVEDVLRLGAGSVVELDKLAGDPVDVWVNNRLIARGEVLVLNDNFCVRVNEILSPVAELDTET